jgi:uroporphyrin-III C-methyltransferase
MTVYLVGAGPGAPDLITIRGAAVLRRADAVVHDRLVSRELLELVPPTAERHDVGKQPGLQRMTQADINQLLVELGRRHECVVRLKGGDPHVFGRAAEEIAALADAGIDTQVVPGISSALAAPAAAGIPLTTRLAASGFTVITAHHEPGRGRDHDWEALARTGTTLVVLMGARSAPAVRDRLLDAGLPPHTPVAVITRATTAQQQVDRMHLFELGRDDISNPAVIVVGAVAAIDLGGVVPDPIAVHLDQEAVAP